MELVGVWSEDNALLGRLEGRLGEAYRFLGGRHPADFAGRDCALLVITPSATGLAGVGILSPRLALVPGENLALARRVRARSAVSYGLGGWNTVTLSSLDPTAPALALQREVYTVSGRLIERQEWVLPRDPAQESTEDFLCHMGALLLLDQRLG